MKLSEICERIKSSISDIFSKHQELEQLETDSQIKAQEAIAALRDAL